MRLVVGISGSTGAIYGIRLLQVLRDLPHVETHLVISQAGKRTLLAETDYSVREVEALAAHVHDDRDIGASLASGSFRTRGMVIAPCSMKTVAALATSYASTLIARAGINRVAPMASGSTTSTYAGAGGSVVSLSSPQREGRPVSRPSARAWRNGATGRCPPRATERRRSGRRPPTSRGARGSTRR